MNSWKTTTFGLMAAIGAGITGAYLVKPDLLAGFPAWLPGIGVLLSSIGTACFGLAARDNNKTSEQVGAGGPALPKIGAPVVALILSLGVAGALTSCSSTPARIAYNGVAAPAITVDHAMTMWGDYVAQFHPPAATELKVKAAFEKYQAAELLAIDAARAYADLNSSGATNTVAARAQTELTSQTAASALADLVNLLQNVGVKL